MDVMHTIESVGGFRASGVDAGLRKKLAPDVTLIAADGPCTAAGVFTTSYVRAAPVLLDEARLKANPSKIRAVLINASCANACTGEEGMRNAEETASWTAQALHCDADAILVMSTGVIGVQLPMDKLRSGITNAVAALKPDGWHDAARAIMTTDTQPKRARTLYESAIKDGTKGATIAGIAKGSGMIAPNMATMLSVVATDVVITAPLLHQALLAAVEKSFNRIVVDGDMSTNDTVLVLASGASGIEVTEATLPAFIAKLTDVCTDLAQAIVRDGEGATAFITIHVTGARTVQEAQQIGNTIAISPLVKTAFNGGDANWGRIMMAVGRAGIPLDQDKLSLWYGDGSAALQLVANGMPLEYDEAQANKFADGSEVTVRLDLGLGAQEATIWTCDFSHDYIDINGSYRS